jgi:tetratricopeptide (TPR) repeat protein
VVIAFAVWATIALGSPASEEERRELAAHAARANAAIQSNNAAAAVEELQTVLRIDPKNVNAMASLGMVEFTQYDYAGAVRQFRAALALSPSLWGAQAFLGMCELRLGNIPDGRRLIESSLPHVADRTLRSQSGLALIESYTASSEYAKAFPALELLRHSDPTNTDVLYMSYRVNSELAAASLHDLNAIAPDSVRVHEVLAQNLMAQERYEAAVAEYHKALERGPRLQGLHYELGQAILAVAPTAENRERAMREFLAELEINPRDADSTFKLAEIAYTRSDLKKARELYLRSVGLRPSFGEAEIGLGKVLADDGDETSAISHLELGIKLKPEDKTAHYRLARLYRGKGRTSDAEREFAVVRQLSDREQSNTAQ